MVIQLVWTLGPTNQLVSIKSMYSTLGSFSCKRCGFSLRIFFFTKIQEQSISFSKISTYKDEPNKGTKSIRSRPSGAQLESN
jgi:hypothetical protein